MALIRERFPSFDRESEGGVTTASGSDLFITTSAEFETGVVEVVSLEDVVVAFEAVAVISEAAAEVDPFFTEPSGIDGLSDMPVERDEEEEEVVREEVS